MEGEGCAGLFQEPLSTRLALAASSPATPGGPAQAEGCGQATAGGAGGTQQTVVNSLRSEPCTCSQGRTL